MAGEEIFKFFLGDIRFEVEIVQWTCHLEVKGQAEPGHRLGVIRWLLKPWDRLRLSKESVRGKTKALGSFIVKGEQKEIYSRISGKNSKSEEGNQGTAVFSKPSMKTVWQRLHKPCVHTQVCVWCGVWGGSAQQYQTVQEIEEGPLDFEFEI